MTNRLLILGLCLFLGAGPNTAYGYEKDTHFGLTYYLARCVGFPTPAALQIAIADWSVDLEPNTQPLRLPLPWDSHNELILERFHAFSNKRPYSEDDTSSSKLSLADELLEQPGMVNKNFWDLWNPGVDRGNPGIALHFLQDIYAHAGYSAGQIGHALPAAHSLDYLSDNKYTAPVMMGKTVAFLGKFKSKHLLLEPCSCEQLDRLLKDLEDANPTPHTFTGPDWGEAIKVLGKALGDTEQLGYPRLDDPDTSSAFRIEADGTVPPRPGGPKGEGRYSEDFKVKVRPVDYLLYERWRDPTEKRPLHFVLNTSVPDENAVDFSGKYEWKFVEYKPSSADSPGGPLPGEWHFSRTPTLEELQDKLRPIPKTFGSTDRADWNAATSQVQGELQWHLILRVQDCKLVGEFYPGKLLFDKNCRHATVPPGKEGWGSARAIEYERAWPVFAGSK